MKLLVELAMRHAQPALRQRRVRIERALEHQLLQVGREGAHHQEQVGVLGRRRYPELGRNRPGDLGVALQGSVMKVTPSPKPL